jgi:D-alanyl-D-alanine carboxypeptidase
MGTIAAATGCQANPASARSVGSPGDASLTSDLHTDLATYLHDHASDEHVSAASLSVSRPGRASTIDVSAGTMRFGGSRPVTSDSVWQIGSNTKAFTSVLLLKLEAQHKLSIHDTLGRWLPQYPRWRDITISSLLHMTSGIASFDDQPAFQAALAASPYRTFAKEQLVSYAVDVPLVSGYHYSNTGYILAEMIIEKASRDSYDHQLYTRIIGPLDLRDLFYRPSFYPPQVTAREPAGYYFGHLGPALAGLSGHDVSRFSMSWTRGAGGIISTTHDMTVWERALYGGTLLPARQQAELTSLVSVDTGQPIEHTTPGHAGFGLGLTQTSNQSLGTIWFYEGGTFGFRTIHMYIPKLGVILALGLNSFTDPNTDTGPKTDGINDLVEQVLGTLSRDGAISALSPTSRQPAVTRLTRRRPSPGQTLRSASDATSVRGSGSQARSVVPAEAGLLMCSAPFSAPIRSCNPIRPLVSGPASAPPIPSSPTSIAHRSSSTVTRTQAELAWACLTTLVSASEQKK